MKEGLRHLLIRGVLGMALLVSVAGIAPAAEPLPLDIGGEFALVDQAGNRRSDKDFRGRLMLVWFGYTECPHSCGMALGTISAALDELGTLSGEVVPLFVTVDPLNDTPSRMAKHLSNFHSSFVGLTGELEDVEKIQARYRAFAKRVADPGKFERLFEHSTLIYLMGRDGRPLSLLPATLPAERIVEIIRAHL